MVGVAGHERFKRKVKPRTWKDIFMDPNKQVEQLELGGRSMYVNYMYADISCAYTRTSL